MTHQHEQVITRAEKALNRNDLAASDRHAFQDYIIDALKYLNRLPTNVIKPGDGLLILSGQVELFVDKSDFRLWALVDGVDAPENMLRCISNNTSISGFWRGWHANRSAPAT